MVGAWAIGRQFGPSAPASKHSSTATTPGFSAYRDPGGLFAGSYPSGWQRIAPANDASVVLLAQSGNGASLLVRKTTVSAQVSVANLASAQRLTDSVVHSDKSVQLLRPPQQVTLSGLPGYLYLYTFKDPSTGVQGAHAHYFLFDGATMVTLVFQAVPPNSILTQAPLFDRIAKTFHPISG